MSGHRRQAKWRENWLMPSRKASAIAASSIDSGTPGASSDNATEGPVKAVAEGPPVNEPAILVDVNQFLGRIPRKDRGRTSPMLIAGALLLIMVVGAGSLWWFRKNAGTERVASTSDVPPQRARRHLRYLAQR